MHARTREGLAGRLAQYAYRLPRLTRQWTHLSPVSAVLARPATQFESDRREIAGAWPRCGPNPMK